MSFLQILLIFFVMVVIVYIIMSVYAFYKKNRSVTFDIKQLLPKEHNADQYIIIDKSNIPLSAQGNEYSISFWMFIKDYNYRYGSNKTILYRGDKANTESNPYIFLHPKTNDMTIKVQLQTDTIVGRPSTQSVNVREGFQPMPFEYFNASNISGNTVSESFNPTDAAGNPLPTDPTNSSSSAPVGDVNSRLERIETQMQRLIGMRPESTPTPSGGNTSSSSNSGKSEEMPVTYDECVVENIPLQKWTHVVVSIFNNSVELYLDGRLYKTCSLKGFPKPNMQNMHVCANGGFNGLISNLEYSNMTLPAEEIYRKYLMGPESTVGFLGAIGDFFSRFIKVFTE